MFAPSRRRRLLKWIGMGTCLAVLGIWTASIWWTVMIQKRTAAWGCTVGEGGVAVWWGMRIWASPDRRLFAFIDSNGGSGFHPPRVRDFGDGTGVVRFPFWVFLVPFVIPTAWLWWRDSQPRESGHCANCGYDLRGNRSGICSECGHKIEAAEAAR